MVASPHPAFAGFDQVLPLAGFSGASIALVKLAGRAPFVRKAGTSESSSAALQKQAKRQRWLGEAIDGIARVPAILGEGEAEGLYHFDMEFVPSRDANSFLLGCGFDELERFAASIEELMRGLAATRLGPEAPKPPSLARLLAKVNEIARRTGGRHDDLLGPLRDGFERLGAYGGNAAATVTHGDLTFENILVNARGELWLIDPIESPVDHYWIDWSKLFQDCEGRWHRHRGKPISLGITRWLRNRWLAAAVADHPDYAARHYLLLALTFARILPYAATDADRTFVQDRVRHFVHAAAQAQ